MILFDTSVVIDARDANSPWHQWAKEQIALAGSTEGAAINSVVIGESGVRVKQRDNFLEHLSQLGFTLLPLPVSAAIPASKTGDINIGGSGGVNQVPWFVWVGLAVIGAVVLLKFLFSGKRRR